MVGTLAGCHHHARDWGDVAAETGCTSELLAGSAKYDSTRVRELVGSYRLVQVDTTSGWIELGSAHGNPAPETVLRLWATDSISARWRQNPFTRKLVRINRPIAGVLRGYEDKGFSADNPQVDVTSNALDYLTVRFTPQLMFDGPLWLLPIERIGSWGFGGYFVEGSYAVPAGRDGRPLGQRAGFYCALRR